jgi:hypothetical protein
MASLPVSADELAFQRLAGLASVDVSANLRALRDDFAQAPSEAQRLGAGIGAALSDGTAVRAVTFVLILVIAGAGLEWLYWTYAAAPLRAIISTSAATPREAAVLALRRLGLLGFGLVLFTASTVGAALTLPWAANVDAVVIAATALVVEVRSVWMIADVVVSPHHPSLRLAPIQRYKSGLVVGGVAWLSILAATAILLPQLLLTVASAPHLAGTIRVGVGAVIVISLLTAVLIASRQGSRSGKGRGGARVSRKPLLPPLSSWQRRFWRSSAAATSPRFWSTSRSSQPCSAHRNGSSFSSGAMPLGKTRSRSQRPSPTCCRLLCWRFFDLRFCLWGSRI